MFIVFSINHNPNDVVPGGGNDDKLLASLLALPGLPGGGVVPAVGRHTGVQPLHQLGLGARLEGVAAGQAQPQHLHHAGREGDVTEW